MQTTDREEPSTASVASTLWDRPRWWFFPLLLIVHYTAIQISFYCGKTAENEVFIWLPNAVLLAALLRFRGQQGVAMAALTFATNVYGNLPTAPLSQSLLLGCVNLVEVGLTYFLLRRVGMSNRLAQIRDFTYFVLAGPLLSCFVSGLLGALVITYYGGTTPFLTLMRVWWFDDGLGLLIFTPLLVLITQPPDKAIDWNLPNALLLLFTVGLASILFRSAGLDFTNMPFTPALLMPPMLIIATRFGVLWTSMGVAFISLATSRMAAMGHKPFGDMDLHLTIIHTQEFILTFSVICMGTAVLRGQLRNNERDLEDKVNARTRELSDSLAQLRQAQTDLVQAEKLASLGAIVAGVAHELNTPIGNALTCASSLQYQMTETQKQLDDGKLSRSAFAQCVAQAGEMTALIERSCHRAADIITSFKQVAVDRASERRRTFNLAVLVNDVKRIWDLGNKNANWSIVANIDPAIECDSYPGPLGQILANLIQNTAIHGFAGAAADKAGTLQINAQAHDTEIVMTLVDNGIGMDANTLAHIFDPFFTTRMGSGGSGLGMSICRNIATGVLGGSLSVTSEKSRGTSVTLTFLRQAAG